MSIPTTVSRVIKYIPELQQQVEALSKKKEDLLCRISRQLQGDAVNKDSQRRISHHNSDFVVSTSRLNDCEAVVHISSYEAHKAPLSEILQCLENNGLLLLNASSSETFGGRVFYNLHFQVCFMIFVFSFFLLVYCWSPVFHYISYIKPFKRKTFISIHILYFKSLR